MKKQEEVPLLTEDKRKELKELAAKLSSEASVSNSEQESYSFKYYVTLQCWGSDIYEKVRELATQHTDLSQFVRKVIKECTGLTVEVTHDDLVTLHYEVNDLQSGWVIYRATEAVIQALLEKNYQEWIGYFLSLFVLVKAAEGIGYKYPLKLVNSVLGTYARHFPTRRKLFEDVMLKLAIFASQRVSY